MTRTRVLLLLALTHTRIPNWETVPLTVKRYSPKSHDKPAKIRSTAEFARHLGLARSTISRVLNRQPGLRPATIEKVEKAMRETGFAPNAHARLLRGAFSTTIGVCVKDFLTPPIIRKMAALQQAMRSRGYSCIIEMLEPKAGDHVIQHFLSLRVDGIAVIGYYDQGQPDVDIASLVRLGIPHVVMDQVGIPNANTVTLDRSRAMEMAMEHLLQLGHRRFGLLGIPKHTTSRYDRMTGIVRALERHGLSADTVLVNRDDFHPKAEDYSMGGAIARDFAALRNRPSAFLALNDDIALGAMHGFVESGLAVPDDVSIIGFNNQDVCRLPTPQLTSIDQQIDETVRAAADILVAQIGKPAPNEAIIKTIEPVLVVRGSTGPARH